MKSVKERKELFLELFRRAKKTYEESEVRLAADGWDEPWKVLITTILSAQNRDPLTIKVGEELFKEYPTIDSLADASYNDVLSVLSSVNYNKSKSEYVIATAKRLRDEYDYEVPEDIDELLTFHGVGRKTANLVISEVFEKPAICVDTHVHRIANVFGLVDTTNRDKTEEELKKIAPKEYWRHINRYFVLWGQDVPGDDKERLLDALED